MMATGADKEFDAACGKEEETGHLDGQASYKYIGPKIDLNKHVSQYCWHISRTTSETHHILHSNRITSGNPTTDSLHNQTHNIASQENSRISSRSQPGTSLAMNYHNPSQRQVNCCSEEDRSDGQCDQIPEEIVPFKWVTVEKHAGYVA